jgi:hypothetical protein
VAAGAHRLTLHNLNLAADFWSRQVAFYFSKMCCKDLWNMCAVVTPIGPAIPAHGFSSGLSLMSMKRAKQLSSSLSFLSKAGFVWVVAPSPPVYVKILQNCYV